MSRESLIKDIWGVSVGIVSAFLILTYTLSVMPFIEELDSPKEPLIITNNKASYCRTVKYNRDVNITIDKVLLQSIDNDSVVSISYPRSRVIREEGTKRICKEMILPLELTEGKWLMRTFLTNKSFPFWTSTVELNKIDLIVKD